MVVDWGSVCGPDMMSRSNLFVNGGGGGIPCSMWRLKECLQGRCDGHIIYPHVDLPNTKLHIASALLTFAPIESKRPVQLVYVPGLTRAFR